MGLRGVAACFNNITSYPLLVTSHITTKILGRFWAQGMFGDVPRSLGTSPGCFGRFGEGRWQEIHQMT